jgi:predicted tellurium resistance membrane protein TerC
LRWAQVLRFTAAQIGHHCCADRQHIDGSVAPTMADLFTLQNLFTLGILVLLQAVLGFDNLLYISIESKRVPRDKQSYVRRMGIGLAIGMRIVLLFALVYAIDYFQEPFIDNLDLWGVVQGTFNVHATIVLFGGAFIIYTAVKEIAHMLVVSDLDEGTEKKTRSIAGAIFWIVLMNLIFSFDSVLSAMALTNVFIVMAIAIVISGLMMMALANRVSEFLEANRMYEVLGLFILFIVGILLLSEGGHLAHLKLFGYAVEPMSKATFYFVLAVLIVIDVVQGRYQKLLLLQAKRERERGAAAG